MTNVYKPAENDSFMLKYYYNFFFAGWQFFTFLTKFSIFFFVQKKIQLYVIIQFFNFVFIGFLIYTGNILFLY